MFYVAFFKLQQLCKTRRSNESFFKIEFVLFINIFIRKQEKLKNMLAAECIISHTGKSSPESRN